MGVRAKLLESIKSSIWKYSYSLTSLFTQSNKKVLWLVGSGRSGTTWVAELINYDRAYREIFEPFHPARSKSAEFLGLNRYIPESQENTHLELYARKVFSGKIFGRRTDMVRELKPYTGLLVKDVFATLFAKWAAVRFPRIKIVLILRNPFAVALSTYKTRDWIWMTDPLLFFKQAELVADYLEPYQDTIEEISSKDDYLLNQILIWCVVNSVTLKQFSGTSLKVVFYENLYSQPELEVASLLEFTRGLAADELPSDYYSTLVSRPSKMIGEKSNLEQGVSPIDAWREQYSEEQLKQGARIIKEFGLDHLYGSDGLPKENALEAYHFESAIKVESA